MTRLDTQTIEKIVYRDLEVVDASLFDTNNGKTKEDADVVDVDTSWLDTILNQPEPTTSIASKLLKAVGEEVIDDEILEEIKDPELKQLMLQNQLRKLMAQDKTHSASPSQPYVISPDILK